MLFRKSATNFYVLYKRNVDRWNDFVSSISSCSIEPKRKKYLLKAKDSQSLYQILKSLDFNSRINSGGKKCSKKYGRLNHRNFTVSAGEAQKIENLDSVDYLIKKNSNRLTAIANVPNKNSNELDVYYSNERLVIPASKKKNKERLSMSPDKIEPHSSKKFNRFSMVPENFKDMRALSTVNELSEKKKITSTEDKTYFDDVYEDCKENIAKNCKMHKKEEIESESLQHSKSTVPNMETRKTINYKTKRPGSEPCEIRKKKCDTRSTSLATLDEEEKEEGEEEETDDNKISEYNRKSLKKIRTKNYNYFYGRLKNKKKRSDNWQDIHEKSSKTFGLGQINPKNYNINKLEQTKIVKKAASKLIRSDSANCFSRIFPQSDNTEINKNKGATIFDNPTESSTKKVRSTKMKQGKKKLNRHKNSESQLIPIDNSQPKRLLDSACYLAHYIALNSYNKELKGITDMNGIPWSKQKNVTKLQQINKDDYFKSAEKMLKISPLLNVNIKTPPKYHLLTSELQKKSNSQKKNKTNSSTITDVFSLFKALKKVNTEKYQEALKFAPTNVPPVDSQSMDLTNQVSQKKHIKRTSILQLLLKNNNNKFEQTVQTEIPKKGAAPPVVEDKKKSVPTTSFKNPFYSCECKPSMWQSYL